MMVKKITLAFNTSPNLIYSLELVKWTCKTKEKMKSVQSDLVLDYLVIPHSRILTIMTKSYDLPSEQGSAFLSLSSQCNAQLCVTHSKTVFWIMKVSGF